MPKIFLKQDVGKSHSLRRGEIVDLTPTQIRRISHEVGHKYWFEGADIDIPSLPDDPEIESLLDEGRSSSRKKRRAKKAETVEAG